MKNKFEIYILLIMFGAIVTITKGLYIKPLYQNNIQQRRFKRNISDDLVQFSSFWNEFKLKLKEGHSDIDERQKEVYKSERDLSNFNEIEILQMIPKIIDSYKKKILSQQEIENLSKIYGNLWLIIQQEAERNDNESQEMNPLLKALYESLYLKSLSHKNSIQTSSQSNTNDINHNTIMEITKKPSSQRRSVSSTLTKKLLSSINKSDQPSQRLLNVAAMLIHQTVNGKSGQYQDDTGPTTFKRRPYKILPPRKATLNLKLTDIPIEKITRNKRDVQIHFSGSQKSADQNSKIDALLDIFRQQTEANSDDSETLNEEDDYEIDDLDEDYNDNIRPLVKNYFYDDNDFYEDDEGLFNPGDFFDIDENQGNDDAEYGGSFQDLILMAERHRLRREMEEEISSRH